MQYIMIVYIFVHTITEVATEQSKPHQNDIHCGQLIKTNSASLSISLNLSLSHINDLVIIKAIPTAASILDIDIPIIISIFIYLFLLFLNFSNVSFVS